MYVKLHISMALMRMLFKFLISKPKDYLIVMKTKYTHISLKIVNGEKVYSYGLL